ncbi:MAG TPA: glycosyltransferase family 4 protein [Anaerolineaceae bacterium]|nr:glycosyltransferase family 4 protein [Anaerolineaceae bacterium]
MSQIPARLGLQQRVLPGYRLPFFEALAEASPNGLALFAGLPRPAESIEVSPLPKNVRFTQAENHHLFGGPFYLCWQAGLLRWLEDWQPEVIILEANPRYLSNPAAQGWMHRRSRPVIGWGLGAPAGRGLFTYLRFASRQRFISNFDALITYSQRGAEEYRQVGFPADKIFVAANAVAARPTWPLPKRPLQIGSKKPVVLFVGRLQERKKVDFLIKACAGLPAQLQPELRIVGDGPVRAGLEHLAEQVYPSTRFYGSRFGSELDAIFREADLFVLPGTGGLAVQQAMSFGLPVMVAEADGTQADLVRPQNGWCLPVGDLNALEHALQQALTDIPALRQMGQASYRIVCEEINLENMVQKFDQAVRSVWEHR